MFDNFFNASLSKQKANQITGSDKTSANFSSSFLVYLLTWLSFSLPDIAAFIHLKVNKLDSDWWTKVILGRRFDLNEITSQYKIKRCWWNQLFLFPLKSSEYYKFSNHFMGNRSFLIRLSQPTTKLLILLQEIISVTFICTQWFINQV